MDLAVEGDRARLVGRELEASAAVHVVESNSPLSAVNVWRSSSFLKVTVSPTFTVICRCGDALRDDGVGCRRACATTRADDAVASLGMACRRLRRPRGAAVLSGRGRSRAGASPQARGRTSPRQREPGIHAASWRHALFDRSGVFYAITTRESTRRPWVEVESRFARKYDVSTPCV